MGPVAMSGRGRKVQADFLKPVKECPKGKDLEV